MPPTGLRFATSPFYQVSCPQRLFPRESIHAIRRNTESESVFDTRSNSQAFYRRICGGFSGTALCVNIPAFRGKPTHGFPCPQSPRLSHRKCYFECRRPASVSQPAPFIKCPVRSVSFHANPYTLSGVIQNQRASLTPAPIRKRFIGASVADFQEPLFASTSLLSGASQR